VLPPTLSQSRRFTVTDRAALTLFEAISLVAVASPALPPGPGRPQIIIEPYESDSI
jgi:hypothetical protein